MEISVVLRGASPNRTNFLSKSRNKKLRSQKQQRLMHAVCRVEIYESTSGREVRVMVNKREEFR